MLPFMPKPAARYVSVPKPAEIIDFISKRVVGQDEAVRTVAFAAYAHYVGLLASCENAYRTGPAFGRQITLLVGPTGSGKSFLVRCLAECLDVPFTVVSAPGHAEAGYVGAQLSTTIRNNLARLGRGPRRAAIVFIDEVDKLREATTGPGFSRDVSGAGVQQQILALADGVEFSGPADLNPEEPSCTTAGLFLVFAGAFVGIDAIKAKRVQSARQSIGFRNAPSDVSPGLPPVTSADLVEFGMLPELVGRVSHLAELKPLGQRQLRHIMLDGQVSALQRARAFLAAHNLQLRIDDAAIELLVARAAQDVLGARALDREMNALLRRVLLQVHRSQHSVQEVVVTPAVVEGAAAELLRTENGPSNKCLAPAALIAAAKSLG